MNNAEFYKEEIKSIKDTIAVTKDGKPTQCFGTHCSDCILNSYDGATESCNYNLALWLISEHEEEPEIDWARVPVDTKIFMRSNDGCHWLPRYFSRYSDNCVYCWTSGTTSFTADGADIRNPIRDVRLADPEDIEKYKKTSDTQNNCCIPIINEPGTRRIRLVKVTGPERDLKKGDLVVVWDNDYSNRVSISTFRSYNDLNLEYPFIDSNGIGYKHCMKIEGANSLEYLLGGKYES